MKIYKYAFLLLIVIAATIPTQKEAQALSCFPSTVQQHINAADVIFSGKVIDVQASSTARAANAIFEVIEYWKGQVVSEKIMVGGIHTLTGMSMPNTQPYFKVGESYIVFAKSVPNSDNTRNIPFNLYASIDCGITTILSSAGELKTTLGQGKPPGAKSSGNGFNFTRNLSQGMSGEDVRELQRYLNQNNFIISASGSGSIGNETVYFGPATKAALIKFQTAYAVKLGIMSGTGYFGALTRALIVNNYYAHGNMELTDRPWTWTRTEKYNANNDLIVTPSVPGGSLVVVFKKDGTISGSVACNTLSGRYSVNNNQLTIDSGLSFTALGCGEGANTLQSTEALNLLSKAESYYIDSNGILTVRLKQNLGTLVFGVMVN